MFWANIQNAGSHGLNNLAGLKSLFPLTPALSLGERGNRSQCLGKSTAEFCSSAHEFYEHIQRLFPLPGGEGQGEGKARLRISFRNNLF